MHSTPRFQFEAASSLIEAPLMIRVGLAGCGDLISTVSHHLLGEKTTTTTKNTHAHWPLSFNLAAGTSECVKFPLGDLRSVFSAAVAV